MHSTRFAVHKGLSKLLSICLVTTIVLDFNVEVETALRAVVFVARFVGTLEITSYFLSTSSIVLLTSCCIPFRTHTFDILIVKGLNMNLFSQK